MWKNRLEELCSKAALAAPFERLAYIAKIREYIRSISVSQLAEEIKAITSPPALRILIAAGVPSGAWYALEEQMKKVMSK